MRTITKKEFNEAKESLLNGVIFNNEATGYFITLRKDGGRVFMINGDNKFFKDLDAFVRATARIVKWGI